jgi:hypothetical protein
VFGSHVDSEKNHGYKNAAEMLFVHIVPKVLIE